MRVVVIGTSGAGKSTFAKALAGRLQVPRVELDALHWLPNWVERDGAEFLSLISQATAGDRWVVDGNYSVARNMLWPRATDIVWLNFSRATVFSRIFRRTLHRCWTKEPLWAGNTESLRQAFLSRKSILLWSLTTYGKNRKKYARLRQDQAFAHLRWHELRNNEDAERFLVTAQQGTLPGA